MICFREHKYLGKSAIKDPAVNEDNCNLFNKYLSIFVTYLIKVPWAKFYSLKCDTSCFRPSD